MTDEELKALMRATRTEGYPEDLRPLVEAVQALERERYIKIMQMIDTHYSGSLDYQPPYVKAARQVLDVIDWPNA